MGVCGCVFHILMLEPLLISTLSVYFCQIADKNVHLDIRYVYYIMLVHRLEQQGRNFTNFHYCHSKGGRNFTNFHYCHSEGGRNFTNFHYCHSKGGRNFYKFPLLSF